MVNERRTRKGKTAMANNYRKERKAANPHVPNP